MGGKTHRLDSGMGGRTSNHDGWVLAADHEVSHESLDGLDHVGAVRRMAASVLRRLDERGGAVSGDHVSHEH